MFHVRSLWRLALGAKLTSKRAVYLVGLPPNPSSDLDRQMARVRWEAEAFNIQVTMVSTPEGAIRALKALAQDQAPEDEQPFFWDDEDEIAP